jgi:environmental stress-induced protein Ves
MASTWKNGGGVTREIAVHPAGAGLDDFEWRISMATVDSGGPFSMFPGVDRSLTVLDGQLTLSIGDGPPVTLDPASEPLAFPGDSPTSAHIAGHPVTDLNVMTRRGRIRAKVSRLRFVGRRRLTLDQWTVVLACSPITLVEDGKTRDLRPLDAALVEAGGPGLDLSCAEPAHIVLIGLRAGQDETPSLG